MLNELKEQITLVKKNIKSENSDYLTGYVCALSAVEGMIAESEKTHKIVDAEKLIKKLNNRIDEFIKKYPDQKNSVAVESVRELIHVIESEVQDES